MEILKNKLFIILSIFLILIFSITSSSFASIDFTYNETQYSYPDLIADGNSYFLIVKFDTRTYLFTSSSPITYLDSSKYSGYGEVYGENGKLYNESGNTWILGTDYGSDFWRSNINNSQYFIYSNADILNKDTGELVFQVAPQEMIPVELMKAIQVEELLPQMAAILKVTLPVCLAIFGTLLLVFLIKSKNLLHL